MLIVYNVHFFSVSVHRAVVRLQLTVGGLAFGRGNTKARTGDKLPNSHKTFREHTPRLTPNRLLGAGILSRFFHSVLIFI